MRLLFWATAVLCTCVALTLALMSVLGDGAGAERASTIIGTIVSLAGLVGSVYALRQTGAGERGGVRASGRGSIAAGGSVVGNAIGAKSKSAGAAPARRTAPDPRGTVSAEGRGAVAAGGDVAGNALGEDSEAAG